MTAESSRTRIVPDEILNKIRTNFTEKYKTKIENGEYHSLDLERVNKDTKWIRAFYLHSLENDEKTVSMIDEVLTWRLNIKANEFLIPNKLPFPQELFEMGAMFMRNKDKKGKPLLHFVVKTHKKDRHPFEHISKFIAYFLEKVYKFNIEEPIVLLFDCSGSGYSNTDIEMTKFVMNCLKTYYAGLIEYLIVYDMPFLFNAIWKIIKALLPAKAVELVKFCDKNTIKDFIAEDQLFVHMGGTDTFKYFYSEDMGNVPALA